MPAPYNPESYRYPGERLQLFFAVTLVLLVIAITATATICTSVIFIALAVWMAHAASRNLHRSLVQNSYIVSERTMPRLARLAKQSAERINPGPMQIFVTPSRQVNAYTFGLDSPKALVLYSRLVEIMDEDELRFVIGHEMGHVALGHTWLNSLVGGLAGIPSPMGAYALLQLAFLSWNRACELSADRAGLHACGRLDKAISALVKLGAGEGALSEGGLEAAYRRIDAEDDNVWGPLQEALGTHPMLIRRVNALRNYAATLSQRTQAAV